MLKYLMEKTRPPSPRPELPREPMHSTPSIAHPESPVESPPTSMPRPVPFPDVTISRPDPTIARPEISIARPEGGPIRPDTALPRPGLALGAVDGSQFQKKADALDQQIQQLRWYQKIPGFSAKPELVKQHALHVEAAQHVQTPEEATLADALLKLPPKNRPDSIKRALEMTRAGEALLPEVVSGQRGLRDATKERVAQIQWALYNRAIQQLEAQAQAKGGLAREQLIGGMTVLDDGGKVAQFMKGVQPTQKENGSYTRPSSHFQETRDASLGMDFKDPNIPLPAGKKTILFGTKDGGSSTYLKGEYSGYDTFGDRFGHIFDFIKTNILGQREVGRREKFIPKDLQKKYTDLGGAEPDRKQLKARGIAYMLDQLPADKKQEFANFAIQKGYNNPEMRKGEEIIIPGHELGIKPSKDAQKSLSRDLATIQRNEAAGQKAKGKLSSLEAGIQHAFGTGVKPSKELTDAFNALRKQHPDVARLALDAMRDPTKDRIEHFFMTWHADIDNTNLSEDQKKQLIPLAANMIDQYMQTNTQFAEEHSAHNFSEPGKPLFPREIAARQSFADFISSLPDRDPRKQASQKLVEAAAKEGFNLQLAGASSLNPYLAIARGQDIVAGPDGFKSVMAMQQGDRAAYRVDHLDLPGADALSRKEKENIFSLLKFMEGPISDAARVAAFDKHFDQFKLEGSTYLNDAQRQELKARLAQFANARDESMRTIFKSVTGHDEMGSKPS